MGTINQPKPTEPKSPQPDTPPLNPGTPISRSNAPSPQSPNPQTPDENRIDREEERS